MHAPSPATLAPRFLAWWRKIGGASLSLSIAIHGLLLFVAALLLAQVVQEKPKIDFLSGHPVATANNAASDALHERIQDARRPTPKRDSPASRIAVAMARPTIPLPDPAAEFASVPVAISSLASAASARGQDFSADSFKSGNSTGQGAGLLDGRAPFEGVLKSRCNMVERLQKLRENGGDENCERAVSNALEWIRQKQSADGSWGTLHKGAMTGLALLCYLGRCYDGDSVYGDTVTRAMLQLVELAQKNPYHIFSSTPEQHAASYEHGIATYALGEMWSFMRLGKKQMPGVREAFERGVQVIIENQLPDGGWGYGEDFCYRKTGAGDLSVTGWQFQALKAAHYSGLKIEGLHKSIDRAVDYLASKQSKDGGFGGTNREQGYNQWNLTGVGLLGLQTLGKGRTKEIKRGVQFAQDFIMKEPPRWGRNANLYAWYYLAQSMFQEGGEAWTHWNSAVLPQLLANQVSDGSWKPETADNSIASTAPAGADREVYRTTLCTLMLEVYYRYLKVGDRESGSLFQP
jgi:hypothetical protein